MTFASSKRGKAKDGAKQQQQEQQQQQQQQQLRQQQLQLQQQQQQQSLVAPYASGGGMSPFSSNNSGADRQRTLDMDPEAVSHVSDEERLWPCILASVVDDEYGNVVQLQQCWLRGVWVVAVVWCDAVLTGG